MEIQQIGIHSDVIQLDQLLKYANILPTGGQIKFLIAEQAIFVNNELCTAKRKKIHIGDIIEIADFGKFEVVREEE